MRKFLAIKLFAVILAFFSPCFSQPIKNAKKPIINKGEDIIRKAREVAGLDKTGAISSYFYKVKTSFVGKTSDAISTPDFFQEISITLPDKIYAIYSTGEPLPGQSTSTWNGEKYKSFYETEIGGKRIVRDNTNPEKAKLSEKVASVLGKDKAAAFNNIERPDPKEVLKEAMWTELFPMILNHPFEPKLEFNYVGKAKSNDKIANIVDVKSANGKTYRLLFDSETNYLLMMIVNFKVNNKSFVGDLEGKYYFSERELINGILMPKKVKVEEKSIATGQLPKIKFRNTEILEFKINPEFKKDMFDIK